MEDEESEAGLAGAGAIVALGGSAGGAGAGGGGDDADTNEGDRGTPPERLVTVPDFTGLSLGAAIRAARRSGVELALDDGAAASGVALSQQPAPGPAPVGTRCQITFGRLP
jgi:hypothetical protein